MKQFKFNNKTDEIFTAILSLKTVKEAEAFFRDLCTIDEIKEMSDRFEIVRLLNQNLSYREIASRLKTSTTTVSRVANWLNNGMDGYKLVLNRLNHHNSSKGSRKS